MSSNPDVSNVANSLPFKFTLACGQLLQRSEQAKHQIRNGTSNELVDDAMDKMFFDMALDLGNILANKTIASNDYTTHSTTPSQPAIIEKSSQVGNNGSVETINSSNPDDASLSHEVSGVSDDTVVNARQCRVEQEQQPTNAVHLSDHSNESSGHETIQPSVPNQPGPVEQTSEQGQQQQPPQVFANYEIFPTIFLLDELMKQNLQRQVQQQVETNENSVSGAESEGAKESANEANKDSGVEVQNNETGGQHVQHAIIPSQVNALEVVHHQMIAPMVTNPQPMQMDYDESATTTDTKQVNFSTDSQTKAERSYSCEYPGCNKAFQRKNGLSAHKSRKHRVRTEQPEKAGYVRIKARTVCPVPYCGKSYLRASALKAHSDRHAAESIVFHCSLPGCSYGTSIKRNIHRHIATRHHLEEAN